MQGARVSRALAEAMQTVQHTKHFAHPANWSGFLLVGADVRLSNKVALMGQGLFELLKTPDKCRDALRVTLHLVCIPVILILLLKNEVKIDSYKNLYFPL